MEQLSRRLHQLSLRPPTAGGTPCLPERLQVAKYREVNSLSAVDAAYVAGLVDGEGTIALSRKHANDGRQLVISISSTERPLLGFAREKIGAGKITSKRTAKAHHSPAFTYSIGNRQALTLLLQILPYLRSYKRQRAELVRDCYLRLTPRNGKYSPALLAARRRFEDDFLLLRANSVPAPLDQSPADG
jgi:LAGLIDADG DNA endonuclease family protein